jgi:hypothetical protein
VGHSKGCTKGKIYSYKYLHEKTENSQINYLIMHLKLSEKQEHAKPKTSRWREIIKIRAKINEIKTKQAMQRTNETKIWFFENINSINKPLANMAKKKREDPN